jgi:hypothetical protein
MCGFRVLLEHDGSEADRVVLLARLERVIRMAEAALPEHLAAMREHVALIQVTRFPCRGAFVSSSRTLIVERTFLADPERLDAEIGATLVHEGEHARLRGTGLAETMSPAEEERACRAAEIAFGERVPGGERVLERAHAAMQLTDHEVAPDANWQDAWSRVDGR